MCRVWSKGKYWCLVQLQTRKSHDSVSVVTYAQTALTILQLRTRMCWCYLNADYRGLLPRYLITPSTPVGNSRRFFHIACMYYKYGSHTAGLGDLTHIGFADFCSTTSKIAKSASLRTVRFTTLHGFGGPMPKSLTEEFAHIGPPIWVQTLSYDWVQTHSV